jgi:hypothetical protein
MKPDDLKKIIRGIIQEELRKQLPALIPQVLTEILNGKSPSIVNKPVNKPVSAPISEKLVKKEFKKYTNNPMLNQILNETTNKIVPESSYTGFSERPSMSSTSFNLNESSQNDDSIDYSMLNESAAPSTPVVANIQPANEDQAKVLGKLNRDFRGLMKAIDEKKKNGTGGFAPGASFG